MRLNYRTEDTKSVKADIRVRILFVYGEYTWSRDGGMILFIEY